jgi:hypothetical protein
MLVSGMQQTADYLRAAQAITLVLGPTRSLMCATPDAPPAINASQSCLARDAAP